MGREQGLTFEDALAILGKYEHPTIEKIDKLLGGFILGGGVVAGLGALGASPLAPVAAFGLLCWGWIEQKDLAVELLKNAVDSVSGRVGGLRGIDKRGAIAAAHSTIVVAAVFESLREQLGKDFYARLKITDEEKISFISAIDSSRIYEHARLLYTSEIPTSSAAIGFEENVSRVGRWQLAYIGHLHRFINGLAIGERAHIDLATVGDRAQERYRSRYLELAAKVPEFALWAQLGEHAATRQLVRESGERLERSIGEITSGVDAIRASHADVLAALNAERDVLYRVTSLLSAGSTRSPVQMSSLRTALSWTNSAVLKGKIIPASPGRYPAHLTIPKVSEIYVNPRYRATEFRPGTQAADDQWWSALPRRDDFDLLLAAHVTAPGSTALPLLLLGHPGAGKSMVTKVLAARLPDSEYTVVRVPLRAVSADARVHRQIEEALENSTDQRIAWAEIAQQSVEAGTVLVVLLDGLDELLQASKHDRSSLLEDVADFQDREASLRRPVVVIVTSRTVVADRVRIPEGTTVVKLDPFSRDDIDGWVSRWNAVNADAIAAGAVGRFAISAARRQPELAEQPLLLMMLALYAADRTLPPLDEKVGTVELYRRIFDGFARREAEKDVGLGHDPSPADLEQRVHDLLDRLTIAALGMFNRGRQDINEEELGKDLAAIDERLAERSGAAEAGQRLIGEFFFVYAPEAQESKGRQVRRAYEFLHATFGEYLVARRLMDELIDATATAFSARRGPAVPNDDLLFALLSHQALAPRWTMLDYVIEIFRGLADQSRRQVLQTLEILLRSHRDRLGSPRYAGYRPTTPDLVRQLAYYSANLVTLRVCLEENSVQLTSLLPEAPLDTQSTLQQWQSMIGIWKSLLDHDALNAMYVRMDISADKYSIINRHAHTVTHVIATPKSGSPVKTTDIGLARLAGDEAAERVIRYGSAAVYGTSLLLGDDPWADLVSAPLIARIVGQDAPLVTQGPPPGTPDEVIAAVASLAFQYLKSGRTSLGDTEQLLTFLFQLPLVFEMDALAITLSSLLNPELPARIPELNDLRVYGNYSEIYAGHLDDHFGRQADFRDLSPREVRLMRALLRQGWNPRDISMGQSTPIGRAAADRIGAAEDRDPQSSTAPSGFDEQAKAATGRNYPREDYDEPADE